LSGLGHDALFIWLQVNYEDRTLFFPLEPKDSSRQHSSGVSGLKVQHDTQPNRRLMIQHTIPHLICMLSQCWENGWSFPYHQNAASLQIHC